MQQDKDKKPTNVNISLVRSIEEILKNYTLQTYCSFKNQTSQVSHSFK